MKLLGLVVIAVLSALLAGCTNFSPQEQPKQTAGTVLGAIGGGLLGAQVGDGAGQLAATAAGTLVGAWLGSEVGSSLDRADRLHSQQATYTALEHNPTGTASTWRNPDTGHYGAVTPTRTYKTAERDCRDYEQTVVVDGQEETIRGTACRESDGTWRAL
ncbi:MAG TPA: RT0821/Lpp0805 family surface protein [Geminicoccaceae bacterium]